MSVIPRSLLALVLAFLPVLASAQNAGTVRTLPATSSAAPAALTACDSSAQLQMTTATTTQLVALAASKKVRVCAYQIQGSINATAGTLKFVYGTGTNCATGTTNITPAWSLAASASSAAGMISFGTGQGEIFQTAAGNALCATSSAASTINVFVTYTVF